MSPSKLLSAATIFTMLAGVASAQAEPFGRDHDRGPHSRPPVPHRVFVPERGHRDHDNLGKALAIGVGAAIVGGIIASEAERHRRLD